MVQDRTVAKWKAVISIDLTPVNKYGDVISEDGGELRFTREIKATTLLEVAQVIENIK